MRPAPHRARHGSLQAGRRRQAHVPRCLGLPPGSRLVAIGQTAPISPSKAVPAWTSLPDHGPQQSVERGLDRAARTAGRTGPGRPGQPQSRAWPGRRPGRSSTAAWTAARPGTRAAGGTAWWQRGQRPGRSSGGRRGRRGAAEAGGPAQARATRHCNTRSRTPPGHMTPGQNRDTAPCCTPSQHRVAPPRCTPCPLARPPNASHRAPPPEGRPRRPPTARTRTAAQTAGAAAASRALWAAGATGPDSGAAGAAATRTRAAAADAARTAAGGCRAHLSPPHRGSGHPAHVTGRDTTPHDKGRDSRRDTTEGWLLALPGHHRPRGLPTGVPGRLLGPPRVLLGRLDHTELQPQPVRHRTAQPGAGGPASVVGVPPHRAGPDVEPESRPPHGLNGRLVPAQPALQAQRLPLGPGEGTTVGPSSTTRPGRTAPGLETVLAALSGSLMQWPL